MRIVHLAALIAAAGRVAPQSPPDIPKIGPTATLLALKQPDRVADRASAGYQGLTASSTHLTMANRANRRLPTHPIQRDTWRPDLKRLPWSVTCLSLTGQGELLAAQNPDGSLVFSAALKDEQGLLSFLLVPPSPNLKRAKAKGDQSYRMHTRRISCFTFSELGSSN